MGSPYCSCKQMSQGGGGQRTLLSAVLAAVDLSCVGGEATRTCTTTSGRPAGRGPRRCRSRSSPQSSGPQSARVRATHTYLCSCSAYSWAYSLAYSCSAYSVGLQLGLQLGLTAWPIAAWPTAWVRRVGGAALVFESLLQSELSPTHTHTPSPSRAEHPRCSSVFEESFEPLPFEHPRCSCHRTEQASGPVLAARQSAGIRLPASAAPPSRTSGRCTGCGPGWSGWQVPYSCNPYAESLLQLYANTGLDINCSRKVPCSRHAYGESLLQP